MIGLAVAGFGQRPAHAADDQQLQLLEDQIRQLQAQIDGLKKEQAKQAAQVQAQSTPPGPQAGEKPAVAYITGPSYMYGPYQTGGNEFGFSSADGQNTIELTGRVHFDVGDYVNYQPDGPEIKNVRSLDSGWDARRVRLGVVGRFMGDWDYGLVADFGGSEDGSSPFVSGSAASAIENAFISYHGLAGTYADSNKNQLQFDIGYIDVPNNLGEAQSSNATLFMERSSAQVVATEIGGGDARSAVGLRDYGSNYWGAFYLTGPAAGTAHNNPTTVSTTATTTTTPNGEPLAMTARATYNPYSDTATNSSVHLGLNGSYLIEPGSTQTYGTTGETNTATHSITLSDRPELRIDPTSFLSTGAIATVSNAYVGALELAATYDSFFIQGEFNEYVVERYGATVAAPKPVLNFDGGYAEAGYTIGGHRTYQYQTGAYGGVSPDHPLSLKDGGWGAVEIALRYSRVNLNDHLTAEHSSASTGGIAGGEQTVYGLGLNYYATSNIRIMLDYMHADIDKDTYGAGTAPVPVGAKIDAVGARFQVAY